MRITSEDLIFFQRLSQCRSLADASRQLGVSPPAVTQRLKALEEKLGARLLDRSNRRMVNTDEGDLVLTQAQQVVGQLERLQHEIHKRKGIVSGRLRIVSSFGFGRKHVGPAVSEFSRCHPEVQTELVLTDRIGRLPNEIWDLAIHVGELQSTRLIRTALAPNERWICAAPQYLSKRGQPRQPSDLQKHACLVLRENDEDVTHWRFSRGETRTAVRIEPYLSTNDSDLVVSWAREGLGIIMRSEWQVAADVAAERLVRLLPHYSLPSAPVVALSSSRMHRMLRVTEFTALLKASLRPVPWRE